MGRYVVKTLGCKANLYDSQILEKELQVKGWSPQGSSEEDVELCIINSCTVTDEADRQTRKMAAKWARDNPKATVVVTGCAAEVDPEGMAASPGVHFVVGNQNKDKMVDLILNRINTDSGPVITSDILSTDFPHKNQKIIGTVTQYNEIISRHPMDREWPAVVDSFLVPPTGLGGNTSKTRAFLKIQEGCNSFCTYCIIPYGRGPSRSLRPRELLHQVKQLVAEGIREIVLTGTNIGDYGLDWTPEPALGDLIEMILGETQLERLRVSSLDPTEITPQIFELMQNSPRFCPHFHVSLQSPHSKILKLMKRKYSFEEVKSCLHRIAEVSNTVGGVFVGMDVITGFPGETEDDFQWTYEALNELPWSRLHVFPYSERSGTPATRLPGSVPQHIRVQRSKKLTQLSMSRLTQHYKTVLEQCKSQNVALQNVLLEKKGAEQWVGGYTSNYLRVLIPRESEASRNQLVSVRPIDLMIDSKGQDVALVGECV